MTVTHFKNEVLKNAFIFKKFLIFFPFLEKKKPL